MAISYRSKSTAFMNAATTLTGTLPTGTAEGDLLLAYVQRTSSVPTMTPPAGWALAPDPVEAESNPQGGASLWWKIAGASEPAPAWTFSASSSGAVLIVAYQGVDPTVPIEENHYVQASGSTALNWPAYESDTDNALAVALVIRYFVTNTNLHAAPPSPFTERANDNDAAFGSNRFVNQVADAPITTAGISTDPGTQSTPVSSTRIMWAAVLRQDASAPPSATQRPYAVLVM